MAAPQHSLPESICPLPWLNLSLDVDGSSRPCCKFAHLEPDSSYQMANLADSDLDEVWNGPAMQRLRRDFRNGDRPAECRSCWDEEAAGIPSFRQTYLADRGVAAVLAYDDAMPSQPVALDLKLTNTCNLRCRICGPVASSAWLNEELRVGGAEADPFLVENKGYFRSNKITGDRANREILRRWLPSLDHVELTGGEPMLSLENRDIIEMIVAEGDPARVTLLITTNGTIVDDRIMSHLGAFGRVTLTLSIDDIGPRFDYERSPARWAEVEENARRYAAVASERCTVSINCSVSPLNVWYLPDIIEWLLQAEGLDPLRFHLNLVHNPRHFNVSTIPEPLKSAVRRRLTDESYVTAWPDYIQEYMRGLVEFMGTGGNGDLTEWGHFLRHVRERDEIRGERFSDVFPEWKEAIDRAGLDESTPWYGRARRGVRLRIRSRRSATG